MSSVPAIGLPPDPSPNSQSYEVHVTLHVAVKPHSWLGVPGPPEMMRDVIVTDGVTGGGAGAGVGVGVVGVGLVPPHATNASATRHARSAERGIRAHANTRRLAADQRSRARKTVMLPVGANARRLREQAHHPVCRPTERGHY